MIKDMIIKRIAKLKNEIHEIEMLEKTLPKEEMTDLNKRERAILKFIEKQINEERESGTVKGGKDRGI